jgi:hypothetical protein
VAQKIRAQKEEEREEAETCEAKDGETEVGEESRLEATEAGARQKRKTGSPITVGCRAHVP